MFEFLKVDERYPMPVLITTAIFSFLAIGSLAALDQLSANPYLIASFGATAVLIYGAPNAKFSRPKNVFFGHLISAIIGVTITMVFHGLGILTDMKWVACAIAVSLAIIAMMVTGTVHPPGGATALTCVHSGFCTFDYVIRPIMLGIIIMMIVATIANDIKGLFEEHDHSPN